MLRSSFRPRPQAQQLPYSTQSFFTPNQFGITPAPELLPFSPDPQMLPLIGVAEPAIPAALRTDYAGNYFRQGNRCVTSSWSIRLPLWRSALWSEHVPYLPRILHSAREHRLNFDAPRRECPDSPTRSRRLCRAAGA